MRKALSLALLVIFFLISGTALFAAGGEGRPPLKIGDEVYVCQCEESCPCLTMSMNPGKCPCGQELAKGKISRIADGNAYVATGGKELAFKTAAKYACGCGLGCKCGTMSQTPGKCVCGREMRKVD